MGRPRKSPRRVVTFNINLGTADRIDELRLSNRSEWANKVFTDYLDNRDDLTKTAIDNRVQKAAEDAQADLLDNLSMDPRRLMVMLYNSLQRNGYDDYKPKGRYTLTELLQTAVTDPNRALNNPSGFGGQFDGTEMA